MIGVGALRRLGRGYSSLKMYVTGSAAAVAAAALKQGRLKLKRLNEHFSR
jgi:hypothetical protein